METEKTKKRRGRKLPKFVREDQFRRMMATLNRKCITGCRNYAILMTIYEAGPRISEVANLTPADIYLDEGLIFIQQGKYGVDRYVPITNDLLDALQDWSNRRPESDYFFCTLKGTQLAPHYIRAMCYRVAENAGVYLQVGKEKRKPSPHKLRHGFATNLLNSGDYNLREVQDLLGHEKISTTQIYTHVAMDKMVEKFRQKKSSM